jgi:hypothetical protein
MSKECILSVILGMISSQIQKKIAAKRSTASKLDKVPPPGEPGSSSGGRPGGSFLKPEGNLNSIQVIG